MPAIDRPPAMMQRGEEPQTNPPHGNEHHSAPRVPDPGPNCAMLEADPHEIDPPEAGPPIDPMDLGPGVAGIYTARMVSAARQILARVEKDMPTPHPTHVQELNVVVDCLSERDIRASAHEGHDLTSLLAYRRDRERWLAVRAATRLTVNSRRFAAMPLHKRLKVLERHLLEIDQVDGEEDVRVSLGLHSIR